MSVARFDGLEGMGMPAKSRALLSLILLSACRRDPAPTPSVQAPRADPAPTASATPTTPDPPRLESVVSISAWMDVTCALLESGQVACWGTFDGAECPGGMPLVCKPSLRPIVLPGEERFREMSVFGEGRGVTSDGRLFQWGRAVHPLVIRDDRGGVVGTPRESLEDYAEIAAKFPRQVRASAPAGAEALGGFDTILPLWTGIDGVRRLRFLDCYEDDEGRVTCARLELAKDGWTVQGPYPWPADQLVFAGFYDVACTRDGTGAITCWRFGERVDSGDEEQVAMRLPLPLDIREFTVRPHGCAVMADGSVGCWDGNALAEITADTAMTLPVEVVRGLDAVHVAEYFGLLRACAVTQAGRVKCWHPDRARLDRVVPPPDKQPTIEDVEGVEDAVALAAGSEHMCALTKAGQVRCWGANRVGQLGNGIVAGDLEPASWVLAPAPG